VNQNTPVGFSQRVQLEWLEQTTILVLAGNARNQIQLALQDTLQDQLSIGSDARRGNREKAISILLSIWVSVPDALKCLRDDGLEHLKRLSTGNHLPIHWGMTMAVYPFFGVVAEMVGRLLGLQGFAAASQVQRRVRERLGERETVARAARRTLRCFIDWGVLEETTERGVYRAVTHRTIDDPQLAAWLVEATLIASGSVSMPLRTIVQSPSLFPFVISPLNSLILESNERLEFFNQGLDEKMVALRRGRMS